jgi:anaerobic selenocysteine-containing dehydrogenase
MKPGKWLRSTCKMCLHSCTTRIHVTEDGVINKIEGDETNPSNHGKLCPKGNVAIMRHYDPNRFKTPLKRTNPEKGPGIDPKWQPISWEEALDTTARELKKSIDEDPRKLLPSIADFQKLFLWAWPAAVGNSNYFSTAGSFCGGGYHPMNGFIHSSFAAANDVFHCNYWINCGSGDGFSSHLHTAAQAYHVANARVERNMRVVCIEPRLSIGGAKAEEWVPIKPATDRQFALGMCHVIVNEGLCDVTFLKKDTNAPYLVGPDGYFVRNKDGQVYVWDSDDNRAKPWNDKTLGDVALEGSYEVEGVACKPAFQKFKDILEDCTPEQMAEITTIPAETIRRIAREFAEAAQIGSTITIEGRELPLRPAAFNYYRGAHAHKYSIQANHAFKLVNFLVGSIDAPGGHVGATLDDQAVDNGHIWEGDSGQILCTPHQLGPHPGFSFPPDNMDLMSYFPIGVHPGHLNIEVWKNPEKYNLEFKPDVMLICHSNPLWSLSGHRQDWFDLMKSMRFIVAIDIIPNETNEWADIILPGHDALESWNMTMIEPPHTEGMCMRQPVTEPLYDTKSEEEIFNELSERLGVLEVWNEIMNEVNGFNANPNLRLETDVKHSDKEIARRKGLLWNGKDLDWYVEHGHAVTERRPDKWYRPWEGQRLHFYIEDIIRARDELKQNMEKAQVPIRNEWHWDDYQPLPTPVLDPVHTEPTDYDLYAITFKDIQLNFGESLSNPWIKDIVYRDPVHAALQLNPKTAAEKGLEDGDLVLVESPYGRIYGRLGLTQTIHPETIGVSNSLSRMMSQHKGVPYGGGHFNDMLPANLEHTDACSAQCESVCKVKITKVTELPDEMKEGTVYAEFRKRMAQ